MSKYLPVPVREARTISEKYEKTIVVILAYDSAHDLVHTTTYGESAYDKAAAAAIGKLSSEAIGCDLRKKTTYEDFRASYDPALLQEAQEILSDIRLAGGVRPHMLPRVRQWCDAAIKNKHNSA